MSVKLKQIVLLLGDVVLLYGSLAIALLIRGRGDPYSEFLLHADPFSLLFIMWVFVFYLTGLYDLHRLKNNYEFIKALGVGLAVNIVIAVLFFYLIPFAGITPKTNLFIFLAAFSVLAYYWRYLYNLFVQSGAPTNKLLLIGTNQLAEELAHYLQQNPQLGYEVSFWMKKGLGDEEFKHLSQIILGNGITTIVIPGHIKKNAEAAKLIYKNLALGIEVQDLAELYESVFAKIPLEELEEVWFLENLTRRHRIYETLKAPIEFLLALLLFIPLIPLFVLIALLVRLTSRGPAIYKQARMGKNTRSFLLYKFRTMHAHQEGPLWTTAKDARITGLGKILRYTHLDELPQLWNVLRGDISFIGPRPERVELAEYYSQLPFYDIRHIIKPGITGWAQLSYRPSASLEEAYEKLKYDIYYIKNRSFLLDILILLRTVKHLFMTNGK